MTETARLKARRSPKPTHVPERLVRRAVRDWLDAKRIPHIPVEARKPIRKNGQIIFTFEQQRDAGIADIICFVQCDRHRWLQGRLSYAGERARHSVQPVAIEVKRYPDGEQSKAQIAWQAWWESLGFKYLLVRSVEDLERGW